MWRFEHNHSHIAPEEIESVDDIHNHVYSEDMGVLQPFFRFTDSLGHSDDGRY